MQRYQSHKLHKHKQQRRQGSGSGSGNVRTRPARPGERQHEEPGWRQELATGNARSLDELKLQVNGRRRAAGGHAGGGASAPRLELNERLDSAAANHLMVDSSLELTKMLLQDIARMGRGRVEGL